MSWDLTVGDFCGNMTTNVAPMYELAWRFVYPHMNTGYGDYLCSCPKAYAAATVTVDVLNEMIKDDVAYREMEPENGWGTYQGAVRFLLDFLFACQNNPQEMVRLHR
jgi:hypothetical protein